MITTTYTEATLCSAAATTIGHLGDSYELAARDASQPEHERNMMQRAHDAYQMSAQLYELAARLHEEDRQRDLWADAHAQIAEQRQHQEDCLSPAAATWLAEESNQVPY